MELQKAIEQREAAHERLVKAVRSHYPLGTRVAVRLGQHTVVGEVVGHGPTWSFKGSTEVLVKNERTGKVRSFNGASPEFYKPIVMKGADNVEAIQT